VDVRTVANDHDTREFAVQELERVEILTRVDQEGRLKGDTYPPSGDSSS
jgi:hypothetical protein